MNFVSYLQGPKQRKVPLSGREEAKKKNYYIILCITYNCYILLTFKCLRRRAMCSGSSMACTETLLLSDDKRGRFRLEKIFTWYSCRKYVTFFASHRSCMCLPKHTSSVLMVSCHRSAPHPIQFSSTSEQVCNFSPPTRTSPYVGLDSTGDAPPRRIPFQHVCLKLNPKSVCIQWIRYSLFRSTSVVSPMIIQKFLVVVVDSGC
jgi:hypothetical protein